MKVGEKEKPAKLTKKLSATEMTSKEDVATTKTGLVKISSFDILRIL